MTTDDLDPKELELVTDFRQHMPKNDDLTSHVLFGHLLIERYMEKALARILPNPNPLEKARLSFVQKLAVIESFDVVPPTPHWSVIRVFNKLRNELAHNLPRQRMLNILRDFEAEFRHHFKDRPVFFDDEHVVSIVDQFVLIAIGGLLALAERFSFRQESVNSIDDESPVPTSVN